jgi:hypothetical protein
MMAISIAETCGCGILYYIRCADGLVVGFIDRKHNGDESIESKFGVVSHWSLCGRSTSVRATDTWLVWLDTRSSDVTGRA